MAVRKGTRLTGGHHPQCTPLYINTVGWGCLHAHNCTGGTLPAFCFCIAQEAFRGMAGGCIVLLSGGDPPLFLGDCVCPRDAWWWRLHRPVSKQARAQEAPVLACALLASTALCAVQHMWGVELLAQNHRGLGFKYACVHSANNACTRHVDKPLLTSHLGLYLWCTRYAPCL
jgi:hypothetical protein